MRTRLLQTVGLMLGALSVSLSAARADSYYTDSYSTPSSMEVSISYTGGSGTTWAVPFTVTPTNSSWGNPGTPFTAFCADLWHSESNADFAATSSSPLTSGFATPINAAAGTTLVSDSTNPTVTNELTYLGTIFNAIKSTDSDQTAELGALALSVWHVIDPNFKVTSWLSSDSNLKTYFDKITGWNGSTYSGGLLGGTSYSATSGTFNNSALTGFVNTSTYSGATFYVVDQSVKSDQNIITWGPTITITPNVAGTPEPSTFAIAGIGALAFVGYGVRRRKNRA
jgi:hypothetical protein